MDEWSAAFTAIGGLAAVGGLIDLALYKSEKEKLKALLEDWWLKFTDVKWSNFGRVEADLAIQILDRWAGPRLWSWKRWRFSVVINLGVLALVAAWVVVRGAWHGRENDPFRDYTAYIMSSSIAYEVIATTVAFALSLSVTRFLGMCAGRLCRTKLPNAPIFALLLVLHLFLLLYWSAVVFTLEWMPLTAVAMLAAVAQGSPAGLDLAKRVVHAQLEFLGRPVWTILLGLDYFETKTVTVVVAHKLAMDLVANGLRILFALVFLSSFVFRPLIQEPVSRLWYGAMNSGKPIFTMLFGAVGTIIAVARILAK